MRRERFADGLLQPHDQDAGRHLRGQVAAAQLGVDAVRGRTGQRHVYVLATNRQIPSWAGKLQRNYSTPYIAIGIAAVLALALNLVFGFVT